MREPVRVQLQQVQVLAPLRPALQLICVTAWPPPRVQGPVMVPVLGQPPQLQLRWPLVQPQQPLAQRSICVTACWPAPARALPPRVPWPLAR